MRAVVPVQRTCAWPGMSEAVPVQTIGAGWGGRPVLQRYRVHLPSRKLAETPEDSPGLAGIDSKLSAGSVFVAYVVWHRGWSVWHRAAGNKRSHVPAKGGCSALATADAWEADGPDRELCRGWRAEVLCLAAKQSAPRFDLRKLRRLAMPASGPSTLTVLRTLCGLAGSQGLRKALEGFEIGVERETCCTPHSTAWEQAGDLHLPIGAANVALDRVRAQVELHADLPVAQTAHDRTREPPPRDASAPPHCRRGSLPQPPGPHGCRAQYPVAQPQRPQGIPRRWRR